RATRSCPRQASITCQLAWPPPTTSTADANLLYCDASPFFARNSRIFTYACVRCAALKFPWPPPGIVSSSFGVPALVSASRSRVFCEYGTIGSASPWMLRIGGRPARTYVIGDTDFATSSRFFPLPIHCTAYDRPFGPA